MILGHDVPTLLDFVQHPQPQNHMPSHEHIIPFESHCVGEASRELKLLRDELEGDTQSKSCNVVTRAQRAKETLGELPFYEAELKAGPERLQKSKARRRRDKFLGAPRESVEQIQPPLIDGIDIDIPPDVGILQGKDPTLKQWFEKVSEVDEVRQESADCLEEVTYLE